MRQRRQNVAPSPPPSIVSLPKTVSLARGGRAVLECAVSPNLAATHLISNISRSLEPELDVDVVVDVVVLPGEALG